MTIASNEAFSGWTKTFTDPRLCAAIVDRLTFAGQIIETGTTSYRLTHALAQRGRDLTMQAMPERIGHLKSTARFGCRWEELV